MEEGTWSRYTGLSVEQVFNLGTVRGAKAVGMEKEVGRLKEGMKADLVVFDGMSPAMLAVAEEDPAAAVVLHSSPRDIDMVLVDGAVRKEGGRLVDVEVGQVVTQMVVKSRRVLKEKTDRVDMKQGEEYVMDLFRMNRKGMLEGQKTEDFAGARKQTPGRKIAA